MAKLGKIGGKGYGKVPSKKGKGGAGGGFKPMTDKTMNKLIVRAGKWQVKATRAFLESEALLREAAALEKEADRLYDRMYKLQAQADRREDDAYDFENDVETTLYGNEYEASNKQSNKMDIAMKKIQRDTRARFKRGGVL